MQKTSRLLYSCLAGLSALVFVAPSMAAAPRSMVAGANATSGRAGTTTARMPTMPTMSINTIGTHAVSGVSVPTGNGTTPNPNPNPNPNPDPNPEPNPDPNPSGCPDGGVRNSDFTVDNCMQSVLSCVQGGALPNGLNDLFNEDLRNSIINGMGLCASQVDSCIRNVRVDCHPVYDSATDVWLDFNSRIVQPEYYNFVLRKTGLTPNQAENVCGLLDKNTYGSSFTAVSASGNVTSEYNNTVNAYNGQGGSKNQPQGPTVNTTANGNLTGVDGERGHYARWDATNAVCKVRVAAYNKDTLITNSWLFGFGDDKPAEVWEDAGSSFTCNKDLFDFSLMNTTKAVAATALPGGAIVGGVLGGTVFSHGARDFDCGNADMRAELRKQIVNNKLEKDLAMYVAGNVLFTDSAFDVTACENLIDLRGKYLRLKTEVDSCQDAQYLVTDQGQCSLALTGVTQVLANGQTTTVNNASVALNCDTINTYNLIDGGIVQLGKDTYRVNAAVIAAVNRCKNACNTKSTRTETEACSFKQLKNYSNANDVYCTNPGDTSCMNRATAQQQVATLDKVFNRLTVLNGQESNRAKGAVVGASVGLGAGGVATAITAFVERNNISCRVGDGLTTVGLGKSYTIESLKDYYVKWNLRVADSISPTARVTSCQDWIDTCGLYTTAEDCNNVVINYQRPNRNTTTEVRSACRMSGRVCIENRSVAVSYGACTRSGIVPPVGPITPVNPNANNQAVLDIIEH